MNKKIYLQMEIAGCPTSCMHCWAIGRRYKPIETVDIEDVLLEVKNYCSSSLGGTLGAYPMHELFEHPEPSKVVEIFLKYTDEKDYGHGQLFEPIPTSGVSIAKRDDWKKQLEKIRELGTKTLWFTVHGVANIHDKYSGLPGAYSYLCTAVQRARSVGLRCGTNVYVNKENMQQFDILMKELNRVHFDEYCWDIAFYSPNQRLRKYEGVRPELADVLPYRDTILEMTRFHKKEWENLESCTESAYITKAIEEAEGQNGKEWEIPVKRDEVWLVCGNNLDFFDGDVDHHGNYYGNFKEHGVSEILDKVTKAIDGGTYLSRSSFQLYFGEVDIPSIHTLARSVGNSRSKKIHFSTSSMRNRWLDVYFEKVK